MRKTLKNILITALSAAMVLGQAATALATESSVTQGPGAALPQSITGESVGPGFANLPPETVGPGVSGPGSENTESTPTEQPETEVPAEQPNIELPADIQQRVNDAHVSVTLLRPEQTWTDVIYASPEGASVTAEQGFMSMSIYPMSLPGDVLYRTYCSSTGWSRWVMNGAHSPWNAGVLVEAVQIRLNGVINDYYDLSYAATLSDGTTCGWSYNGDTNGTMAAGKYITGLQVYLTRKGVHSANKSNNRVVCASSYDGIQFGDGLPVYVNGTGEPFTGWAWDCNNRYYFVDNNAVTGWQYIDGYKYYFDESGKLVTDLEPIIGAGGPYLIKINKQMNCTTVYVQDGGNGYIIPLKSFLCSTGDDTPIGTFHTPEKYRWHLMIHDVYCQYLTRLGSGLHILLHSAVYNAPNANALQTDTYNYMGVARSAGCIRFMTKDCKWIYDNCPLGTTIQVYNSSIPGPYERPCVPELISLNQTWDPTDPDAIAQHQPAAAAPVITETEIDTNPDNAATDTEFWSA